MLNEILCVKKFKKDDELRKKHYLLLGKVFNVEGKNERNKERK